MSQEVTRQSRIATQIATKQEQISSGKRMQRASDDPFASSRIAEIGRLQSNDSARNRNISIGISFTGQADGLLGSMSTLLERAQAHRKELRWLLVGGAGHALINVVLAGTKLSN